MGHAFTCESCGLPFVGKPSASLIEGKLRDAVAKINLGEEVPLREYCPGCAAEHWQVDDKQGS